MTARPRPEPPSGQAPPRRARLADGTEVDLAALAVEVCARYRAEFADEEERYGEAGELWCRHDNQHIVNWAVLHGETQTGATLHEMIAKPDAGRIVDQEAVPILPDELAVEVFGKVTAAAERVLARSLPRLLAGTAAMHAQDLSLGSYFGGRRPEDGRVDWRASAKRVHDLVRAVAPPYPGAFTEVEGKRLRLLRTRLLESRGAAVQRAFLYSEAGRCLAACADGGVLEILEPELDGRPLSAQEFARHIGARRVPLH